MLAILNLQQVPASLPDEVSGTIDTGDDGQPAFTEMLRMRIDSAEGVGGDLLPDSGIGLPLAPPDLLATDSSLSPDLGEVALTTASDGEPEAVELQVAVDYPQGSFVDLHEASVSATVGVPTGQNLAGQESSVTAPDEQQGVFLDVKSPIPVVTNKLTPDVVSQTLEIERSLVPSPLTTQEKGQQSQRIFAALGAERSDDAANRAELPRLPGTATLQAAQGSTDSLSVVERPLVHQVPPSQGMQILPHTGAISITQHASAESPVIITADLLSETINTPVHDSNWGEHIGERVLMMAGKQLKSAEIRLTPADLGPVRVHVSVDEGLTNVSFHAHHAMTREALEQALPRLRELLAESGLSLGQASVNDSGVSAGNRDQNSAGGSDAHANGSSTHAHSHDDPQLRQKVVTANGLIDTFA